MRGTVIHNPEDAPGAAVGFLFHDLPDKPAKGLYAGGAFTTAKHSGPAHVPGSQISEGTAVHIRIPPAWAAVAGAAPRDANAPALECWFFRRRKSQSRWLPKPGPPRLPDRDQAPVRLWFGNGDRAERSSSGAARGEGHLRRATANGPPADLRRDSAPDDCTHQVRAAQTRKRQSKFFGQLAGNGFDLHPHLRGKNRAGARHEEDPQDRGGVLRKTVCAIC